MRARNRRDLSGGHLAAFYHGTLGLELLYYEEGAFAFFCLPGRPDFQIALYPGREEETAAVNHWFIVIDVPDIEGVVGRLRGLGVEVSDIGDVPFGRAAKFSDPEGNTIEIHQSTG